MERLITRSNLQASEGSRGAISSPEKRVIRRNLRRSRMYVQVLRCRFNILLSFYPYYTVKRIIVDEVKRNLNY